MTQHFEVVPIVKEGIVLIKQWIKTKREEFAESDDFKELVRVLTEIENENDYSHQAYEDIRYLLRPFPNISFHLKRQNIPEFTSPSISFSFLFITNVVSPE